MANLTKLSGILGVSPATISRVLNNNPTQRISDAKRQLIIDAAKRYNYRPNMASRALAMRKTMNVAVVMQDVASRFATTSVLIGLERTLQEHHYGLNIAFISHREPVASFRRLIKTHRTFDALLFHSGVGTRELVEIANEAEIPNAILVDWRAKTWPTNYYHLDEDGDTRVAIDHLMSLGHRKIAAVGWDVDGWCAFDTFTKCARDYLHQKKLAIPDDWIISAGEMVHVPFYAQRDHGRASARKLFRDGAADHPTAVIAWGDEYCRGIIDVLAERGLRIGHDVAVVGYGNTEPAAGVPEEECLLTTFAFPIAELGKRAAEHLLRRIDNPDLPRERVLQSSRLIVRSSTQPKDVN